MHRAVECKQLDNREKGLRELLIAWHQYEFNRVIGITDQLLTDHPSDLATLKIAQYHLFNSGNSPGMLRMAMKCQKSNYHRAPWHSMRAFGHEQCHHIDAAERSAIASH